MTVGVNSATGTVPRIESDDLTLADLFKDFYTVPDFQREFVWEQSNVERLLTDLLDEFYDEDGRPIGDTEYFIGSIVTCRNDSGMFQLIDGQQRLTTIYLILCALRDALTEAGDRPSETLQGQIRAPSMDPRTGEDRHQYRLVLQYEDSHGVLEDIADPTKDIRDVRRSTASVRSILSAYGAIREFLRINFDDDPAKLKQFFAILMNRVKLIRIETPDLAHSLKVFETINDRGIGLNAMDLLKNLLFMRTGTQDYPVLKERWKRLTDTLDECDEKPLRFLRYYVMSHHETDLRRGLREDQIYQWFVDHSEEAGITSDPLAFVAQLEARSRAYANFIQGKDPRGEPNRYLRNLQVLSGIARQHFILLLAGQHLAPREFDELCRNLENLFFTYIITRESTKNFERNFARWAPLVRAIKTADDLNGFVRQHFLVDMAARSRAFDFAFSELSADRIQQYRMRYILAKLTQFIDEQAWGNPEHRDLRRYLDSSVHVEHILPQSPTAGVREAFDKPDEYSQYAARLGNLTLLEKTINTSVSNNAFSVKRPGYAQSMFLLTKSIAEEPRVGANTQLNRAVRDLIQFEVWDSEAIELRQAMLGDLARHVWLRDAIKMTEEQEA